MWEQTDKALQSQRFSDQADFANIDKRMGKAMMHTELVARIHKLAPDVWVEDSINYPGHFNWYCMGKDGKKALNCPCEKGYVPEFSIIFPDAADLPTKLRLGWRTILQRLVQQRVLTKQQVIETWGDVHYADARGKYWQANLAGF